MQSPPPGIPFLMLQPYFTPCLCPCSAPRLPLSFLESLDSDTPD